MRAKQPTPSREMRNAEAALSRAVRKLFREAKRNGEKLAIWKNGRVVMVGGNARSRAA